MFQIQSTQVNPKEKLLLNFIRLTAVFAIFYAVVSYAIDFEQGVIVMSLNFLLHVVNYFLYQKTSLSYRFSSNFYIVDCFFVAVLECAYFSGGLYSPVAPWFVLIPIIALLLLGDVRDTVVWLIIVCLGGVAFAIHDFMGIPFPVEYNVAKYKSFFVTTCWLGLILIIYLVVSIFESDRSKAQKNLEEVNEELSHQSEEINQQNEELVAITEQLRQQKHVVELSHKKITDSINYAERIQRAILPQSQQIAMILPETFVFFRPRDIVSGDFYWASMIDDDAGNTKVVFATADCTGHGVPGAFMSMIGTNLLEHIVNDSKVSDPATILEFLHAGIHDLLKQDKSENRDGIDISISVIDWDKQLLSYAGAKRPLYYVQNGEMFQVKGNPYPVGGVIRGVKRSFVTHTLSFEKHPIMAYTFSDGYPDQIGGEHNRKFMTKHFRKLLHNISGQSMQDQQQHLETVFDNWQGECRQLDDILVVGMRLEKRMVN